MVSLENTGSSVEPADLESYGLIPELLGRFPVICSLAPLSEGNLMRIMVEAKNSIVEEYKEYFRSFGVEIEFREEVLKRVAKDAAKRGTGARGLRSILESVLRPYFFMVGENHEQTTSKIIIDEKTIKFQPCEYNFTPVDPDKTVCA